MSEGEFSERPWGNYTVLSDDAPDHKVKRIVVSPGKRLSYSATPSGPSTGSSWRGRPR